jgi:hypothetical protein
MKCAGCGKEIPASLQKYDDFDGEKIPVPCRQCVERLKEQSRSIDEAARKKRTKDKPFSQENP